MFLGADGRRTFGGEAERGSKHVLWRMHRGRGPVVRLFWEDEQMSVYPRLGTKDQPRKILPKSSLVPMNLIGATHRSRVKSYLKDNGHLTITYIAVESASLCKVALSYPLGEIDLVSPPRFQEEMLVGSVF